MHCLLLDQIFFIFDFSRFDENDVIFIFRAPPPSDVAHCGSGLSTCKGPSEGLSYGPVSASRTQVAWHLALFPGSNRRGRAACSARRVLFFSECNNEASNFPIRNLREGQVGGDGVESCDEYILGMVVATR